MTGEPVDQRLAKVTNPKLRKSLEERFEKGEAFSLTAPELAKESGTSLTEAHSALTRLVEGELVLRTARVRCPACRRETETDCDQCEVCSEPFADHPSEIIERFIYAGVRSRDTRWMFTIHGMNTHAPWQQDFSWLVAGAYGYAIPIFIYKYGRIRLSPLLGFRQNKYVEKLQSDLRAKIKEIDEPDCKPDILAHSFGTWLLAEVLKRDTSLKIGRVILTGSIVPPAYDWTSLIRDGRVDAVLCHVAGRDLWVRTAPFTIPASGPSGFVGFRDRSVSHVRSTVLAQ